MRNFIIATGVLLGVAVVGVVGCDRSGNSVAKSSSGGEASQRADALPASLIANTQPSGDVIDVVAAKQTAKQGDHVLVRGRIGAQKEPLAKNRAILTLADLGLTTCDKSPMKECDTPWDSCCQPPEERSAKSATVQVVDNEGRPLKTTLQGVSGIAPGKNLVVSGTVTERGGNGEALVIAADQIYVQP